jgi:lipoyl(octanoyl) transferase
MGRAVSTLTIWWDTAADGPTNMAADECLAAEAERRDSLLIRFYEWSTTTISLGGFQKIETARQVGDIRGIPLVRRPSGGGAIVHGSDLTYAAAVPKSHPWGASPQVFYDALHGAMVEALAAHGIDARPYPAAGAIPPPADGTAGSDARSASDESQFFCFDRRAAGDLVMAGARDGTFSKVMGSAQRRLAGVVLQHGSLLLHSNTGVAGAARHLAVADLVADGQPPERVGLSRVWGQRIATALGGTAREEETSFLSAHHHDIAALTARFCDERWTFRR